MGYSVEYLDGECETAEFVSRAGKVKITYENGNVFTGTVDEHKVKHGQGELVFAAVESEDGETGGNSVYVGDFINGARTGVACMTYADGTVYRGEFTDGFRHGMGSYTYPNSDIYSGSWQNDMRSGHGTYLFAESGCTMEGEWEKGCHVQGSFVHPDGTSFEGAFVDGCHTSITTATFPHGMTTKGEFYLKGDEHHWVRKSVAF